MSFSDKKLFKIGEIFFYFCWKFPDSDYWSMVLSKLRWIFCWVAENISLLFKLKLIIGLKLCKNRVKSKIFFLQHFSKKWKWNEFKLSERSYIVWIFFLKEFKNKLNCFGNKSILSNLHEAPFSKQWIRYRLFNSRKEKCKYNI